MTDMLVAITEGASIDGQIEVVVPYLVDGGQYILQFADDTILLIKQDIQKASNLKLIFSALEQLFSSKNKLQE
jgi:hypothetical protein